MCMIQIYVCMKQTVLFISFFFCLISKKMHVFLLIVWKIYGMFDNF